MYMPIHMHAAINTFVMAHVHVCSDLCMHTISDQKYILKTAHVLYMCGRVYICLRARASVTTLTLPVPAQVAGLHSDHDAA
jgi:hypothetical protein